MKKEELSFKCVVPNSREENNLFRILNKLGFDCSENGAGWCFIKCDKYGISANRDESDFCNWPDPLMSYEEALKLIESIELDAPEFDIKPFDRVLMRDGRGEECKEWWPTFATCFIEDYYHVDFLRETFMQMIKYEGNEKLIGTSDTPAGWWECENGKPVWKTK